MDAKLLTLIGTVVPTIGYLVAASGFWMQGNGWTGGLWFFYACANVCIMKTTGVI